MWVHIYVANVWQPELELLLLGLVAIDYLGTNMIGSGCRLPLLVGTRLVLALVGLIVLVGIRTDLVDFISLLFIVFLSIILVFNLRTIRIDILLLIFTLVLLGNRLNISLLFRVPANISLLLSVRLVGALFVVFIRRNILNLIHY